MAEHKLVGSHEHDIRVLQTATNAFGAIPWSWEKNAIRAMCNDGVEFTFCTRAETEVFDLEVPEDDPEWADTERVPECVDAVHFEPDPNLEGHLLTVGRFVVWFDSTISGDDRSASPVATLRCAVVRDIRSQGEIARKGFGLS